MNTATLLTYIGQTLIATAIIFIAWGHDEPIYNFALVSSGLMLGHVITEALNFVEGDE